MSSSPGIWSAVKIYDPGTGDTKLYPADTSFEPYRREAFRHRSIPAQREAIMLTNISGEGTVNTEGLWRRESVDWSMGAGQFSLDRKGDAQENRFYSSKGVDVFSYPLQATLLPDTHQIISNAGTGLQMVRCGDNLVTTTTSTVTKYSWSGSAWGSATNLTVDTTYGGSSFGTINSIASNDTYVFIATSTGVWFGLVTGTTLALYAAPDLSTNYTGGYSLVRWANDQIIASYKGRLYAFQPRSATGIPFGTAPSSVGPGSAGANQINITNIIGGGSFLSTAGQAEVFTAAPHGLTTGQQVTIQNSQIVGDIASIALSSGVVTVTATLNHGLQVGQQITVSLTYTTGKVITEIVNVSAINSGDATKFSYKTSKVSTTSHFSLGQFTSSQNGYGYNNTYTVTVLPPTPQTLTSVSTSGGFVTYTVNQLFSFSVGDTITVAGASPAGYNGTFVVQAVGGTTGAYTAKVANSTTGASSGGTVTQLSRLFTIPVPTSIADNATGGNITITQNADVLYTHQNPNWVWSDATGGETQIYLGGYVNSSVGKSAGCIYRSNLLGSSTTAPSGIATVSNSQVAQPWQLDTPVQALPMSPDEYPTCVKSYLNYIFIGTNRGIRMAQTLSIYDPTATATGDLKSGPLIPNILQPVTLPVTGIVGDGRFVWWTWNNYDGTSTGLGKLDLSTFIAGDPLAPAYASDIMITAQGTINSLEWDPANNVPLMALQGYGVYSPYAKNLGQGPGGWTISQYVTTGNILSGVFDYGIPDPKIPVYFDYDANVPTNTTLTGQVVFDPYNSGTTTQTPTSNSYVNGQGYPMTSTAPYVTGKQFQTILTLTSTGSVTPTLHRWTLKAWPAVVSGTQISAVVRWYVVDEEDGGEYGFEPYAEFIWCETRRQNQDIVTYSEGPLSVQAVITEVDWIPHKKRDTYEGGLEGDAVIYLKTISPYTYTAPST